MDYFRWLMQAPRLRSMFRNVRTEPKRFEFKSRHLPDLDPKWETRKQQVEAEVAMESGESLDGAEGVKRKIRFGQNNRRGINHGKGETVSENPRQAAIKSARFAMLRATLIAVVLIWLAWKGIQWVEQSDFSEVLKWIENA